jgi:hypothetical protein
VYIPLCRKEQHAIPLHVPRIDISIGAGCQCSCSAEFHHKFTSRTGHAIRISGAERAFRIFEHDAIEFADADEYTGRGRISGRQLLAELIAKSFARSGCTGGLFS